MFKVTSCTYCPRLSIATSPILILGRAGLPKKGESFFFFVINKDKVPEFCTDLANLVPLITTAAQCLDDRDRIIKEKKRAAKAHTTPVILEMSGVNIAFSQKGLQQVGAAIDRVTWESSVLLT